MKKKKLYYGIALVTMLFLLFVSGSLVGQDHISGTVTDATTNEALPGVNVTIKGSQSVTVTDFDGKYSLQQVSSSSTLVFSFVGYTTQEVVVGSQTQIDVKLSENITQMEQVVVVGYGTQKKSDLTGAVAVVETKNLEKTKSNDITKMLQGQVAGVTVQSSGEPGAVPIIKIRGAGSFGSNAPLYVIDGIPVTDIKDFSPGDIETMQILKDASASAIYGSRGANGVIIITTKHGKKGNMQITYDGSYGLAYMPRLMDVTDRAKFQELNNEARDNDGGYYAPGNDPEDPAYITNINTDWQKEALKTGKISDQSLSFSGGEENSNYNISLNYFDQDGQLVGPGPKYTRYSGRVNTEQKKGKFKMGQSFYYAYSHQINLTNSQWGNTAIMDIITAIPTVPVYDTANKFGGYGGGIDAIHSQIAGNEIGYNNLKKVWGNRNRFMASMFAEYEIVKGLNYRVNASYDRTDWLNHEFIPEFKLGDRISSNAPTRLKEWRGENPYMILENTITYTGQFGNHNITVMGGYTSQSDFWAENYTKIDTFTKPYLEVIHAGFSKPEVDGTRYEHALISTLGRLNYSYADKYLLTANFRRDGSSRFGANKKYGIFPSVSVAWKISNEEFFKPVSFVNSFKIRGGVGKIGNEKIGDYMFETTLNNAASYIFSGNLASGIIQTNVVDPSIHWEERETRDIGFDASLLRNKLEISAEYYYNIPRDILFAPPIPMSVGSVNFPTVNAASMINKGIELSVIYKNTKGDFHYEISANASTLKNEVTKLGRSNDPITVFVSKTEIGGSMGEIYGFKTEGIFQNTNEINKVAPGKVGFDGSKHPYQINAKPGDVKFVDVNGDSIITEADRTYLGSAIPWLTGGLNINVEYKNFDFNIFVQGVYGNKIYNGVYQALNSYGYGNYSVETYNNRWTGEGTTNKYPRMTGLDGNGNNRLSDRFIQDGSYARIQNIQLGYSLPSTIIKHIGAQKLRIYVSSQNLYTFTKYTGFDPDISNDLLYKAHDYGQWPNPRSFYFGAKVTF